VFWKQSVAQITRFAKWSYAFIFLQETFLYQGLTVGFTGTFDLFLLCCHSDLILA